MNEWHRRFILFLRKKNIIAGISVGIELYNIKSNKQSISAKPMKSEYRSSTLIKKNQQQRDKY